MASLDAGGVSYTEREYKYAIETGKTVLAFIHQGINQIPLGKTDKDSDKTGKLLNFTDRVKTGRLVQFWTGAIELRAQAIVSLQKAFSESPQVGWVRADTAASSSVMSDIIKYRNENDNLKKLVSELRSSLTPKFSDAADLSAQVKIRYIYYNGGERSGNRTLSYGEALVFMAPTLHTPTTSSGAELALKRAFVERLNAGANRLSFNSSDVQDLLMHLVANGHVKMCATKTTDGLKHVTGYQLTSLGVKYWQEGSYVRNSDIEDNSKLSS